MPIMVRQWLCWTMTLAVTHATAQSVTVDTISAMQPWSPHEEFTFPHFSTLEEPQLAERINRAICIDFLEIDPDTAKGSIFQLAWGDPGRGLSQRLYSLTWSSAQPLPEVLSISFSGEGCGAYCEGFTIHYSYDLRDGHSLSFDSLFNRNGRKIVDDTLRKNWQTAVAGRIQLIHDSLDVPDLSTDNGTRWKDALDMYRECLLERADQRPYVADFEPRGQELRVYIARCSAHVDQDVDDIGEVFVDLPYEWLGPYLRPAVASLFRK